ncbi:MAG: DUF3108 domain-containing protein [Pseudomonadota bacterium]
MTKLMRLSRYPIVVLLLLTAVLFPAQAAQMRLGERLEYTFSYQGIFSGFMQMNIARAVFDVQPVVDTIQGRGTVLTTLNLTTEPFGKAELLYPIRYRYRSWMEPERQAPVVVSEYLETDKISEELLWFDRENRLGYCFVKGDEATEVGAKPPDFLLDKAGLTEGDGPRLTQENRQEFSDEGVWDYLSLLYRLRFLDLAPGRIFELPLYNGKRIKQYQVEVSRERLELAGWNLPAFKLSLYEAWEEKRQESTTSVWVSDDEQRLPLRFYVQRAFGDVQGILETGRPLTARQDGLSEATKKSLELIF